MHDRAGVFPVIRYKCTVAYDGSAYCGWQTQKHGDSVQEQIENALAHISNGPVSVLAAGRTDAGVNAWGQVFQFDSKRDMTERKLMGALNGYLPDDIHIRKVEKKDRLFHARYGVRAKRYDYRIGLGEYNVFTRNWVYQCPYELDIEAMKKGAVYLKGTHDFTSFNSNTLKETPDQVRTIDDIVFHEEGGILTISFHGRGFLRYMVRMMTAQLLEAGRGRIEPEDIKRILEAKSKTVSRRLAHPEGLTLAEIDYYETAALTDHYAVREYLPEDELPAGRSLSELELPFRTGALPLEMIFADRRTNAPYGSYRLESTGGLLRFAQGLEEGELGEIEEQLKAFQKKRGCDVPFAAETV
jgi:tRNA pseudouridine38-40 synthase